MAKTPEAIDHGVVTSVATGGWEATKGAVKGLATIPLIGAVMGAAVLGGGAALLGVALMPVIALGLIGATAGGIAGTGVVAGSMPIAGTLAAVGGLIGLGKGANKVGQEKAEYIKRSQAHERTEQAKQGMQAHAMQEGYQMGFQQGQTQAVEQIQAELQQQMALQQQAAMQHQQAALPADGHVAKEMARRGQDDPVKQTEGHADMIAAQKEQAASAEPKIS